jgi:Fe-Mn family superoxide dismutase
MKHLIPPLPYEHAALEPHIDAHTMVLHHDKHHAAYVAGLRLPAGSRIPTPEPRKAGRAKADLFSKQRRDRRLRAAGHKVSRRCVGRLLKNEALPF